MKKVGKDPFSNGTEFMMWNERNCERCIKNSHLKKDLTNYTKIRCAIQRDILTRMGSDEPIAQRTIDACEKSVCPHIKTEWPKRKKKVIQPTLFEI